MNKYVKIRIKSDALAINMNYLAVANIKVCSKKCRNAVEMAEKTVTWHEKHHVNIKK